MIAPGIVLTVDRATLDMTARCAKGALGTLTVSCLGRSITLDCANLADADKLVSRRLTGVSGDFDELPIQYTWRSGR